MPNLSGDITALGYTRAGSFFRFADRSPLQLDYGSRSFRWVHHTERVYVDPLHFDNAHSFLDNGMGPLDEPEILLPTGSLLHFRHSDSSTGLTLPVPASTLQRAKAFTVELWVLFEDFAAGNFSVVGVPNQLWDQGFSIAGVMTSTTATVACVLDTELTSSMKKDNCYADTKLCLSTKALNTWIHIFCARRDTGQTDDADESGESDVTEGGDSGIVMYNVAEGTMGLGSDVKTASGMKLKADVEELFEAGKIVIETKYKEDSGMRTRGFNGYARELRIWSRDIGIEFARYAERERLEGMEHSNLAGYWPLFDGSLSGFAELSEHSTDFKSTGTASYYFNGGAAEWTLAQHLPKFPYCFKGYVYSAQSSACVKKKENTALYIDSEASDKCEFTIPKGNKQPSGEGFTLSIWVYFRKVIVDGCILIGMTDVAEIKFKGTGLVGHFKGTEVPGPASLPTNKWAHYALAGSAEVEHLYFFHSNSYNTFNTGTTSFTFDSELKTFVVGKKLVGYVREAKVWSKSLVRKSGDAVDVSAVMGEKFQ